VTFIVFSLPRSRSAWLSVFLSHGGRIVGHDAGVDCATPEDFTGLFGPGKLAGTCETGAGFAWPLIKAEMPDVRPLVVRRPAPEVVASLERFGITGVAGEMQRREAHLAEISADPRTLTVDYASLTDPAICAGVYSHCLGAAMPLAWWRQLDPINIQVDMKRQLERLGAARESIAALKAEVARRTAKSGYSVALEPWTADFWREAKPLALAHFEEVDGGIEPNRPFDLDEAFMSALAERNVLKLLAGRLNGELVGYLTWNVTLDVESRGLLIGMQGAWYVAPGHPRLARMMFEASKTELRAMGVKMLFPHHRTQGRGASLGRFFKRQGATKIQDTYSLWIGN